MAAYKWVAAVVGQDDDVNGCRVIGYTDAASLWFVLSGGQNGENQMHEFAFHILGVFKCWVNVTSMMHLLW